MFTKSVGYNQLGYPVLVGNSVKVYSTKDFAKLPHRDYFMVKERIKESCGMTKAKLTLKHYTSKRFVIILLNFNRSALKRIFFANSNFL